MTTRRSIVQCAAGLLLGVEAGTVSDAKLAILWSQFLSVERHLDQAWARVDAHVSRSEPGELAMLSDAADAIGHEHDLIVHRIAAQPASSWQGVTIKLLAWRRTASLSASNPPDTDTALAFSAYCDALRLCPGAASDAAIARKVLRHPDNVGEGA